MALPLLSRAAICFPAQAQFNPLDYLAALVRRIPGDGSHVFEQARVLAIDEGEPCRLHLEHGAVVTADRVVEPIDGLPLIGKNALSDRVYVATGFSGNGMTFGTLAAMLLRDICLDRANPDAELYAPSRIKTFRSLATFIGENLDYPLHLLSDALKPPEVRSLEAIRRGEGKSVRLHGERFAVHRDESDDLHAVSPVCTHLGCHVRFNPAEKTWDRKGKVGGMFRWVKALLCTCSLVFVTAQCRDRSAAPSVSPPLPPAEEPAEGDQAPAPDAGAGNPSMLGRGSFGHALSATPAHFCRRAAANRIGSREAVPPRAPRLASPAIKRLLGERSEDRSARRPQSRQARAP